MAQTVTSRTGGGASIEIADFVNSGVSTTASYADILTIDARSFRGLVITLVETGAAQSFLYRILGSIKQADTQPANNDTSYVILRNDTSVSASGNTFETLGSAWKWIIVQVKNNSGAATVTARASGTG